MSLILSVGSIVAQDDPSSSTSADLPASIARFEPLVGRWDGRAIPTANRLKGWKEEHAWAWRFDRGEPVGVDWTLEASKIFSSARLDPVAGQPGQFLLSGKDPAGHPLRFRGDWDETGRTLTLVREQEAGSSQTAERLVLRVLASGERYTMWYETKSRGQTRWVRVQEINLGRAGREAIASGEADKGPKCIVTGGTADMTVSVHGTSFPICCTGCRDEVTANPEKYLKKLQARAGKPK